MSGKTWIAGAALAAAMGLLAACGPSDKAVPLYDLFPSATLSSEAPVDAPTGKGVFVTEVWETASGPRRSVVVVSGFSVAFPALDIKKGQNLTFEAAPAYKSAYPVHFWVASTGADGVTTRIWEEDFLKNEEGPPTLRKVKVPLESLAGQSAKLVIGVETINGDSSGHWGVFVDPSVQ